MTEHLSSMKDDRKGSRELCFGLTGQEVKEGGSGGEDSCARPGRMDPGELLSQGAQSTGRRLLQPAKVSVQRSSCIESPGLHVYGGVTALA